MCMRGPSNLRMLLWRRFSCLHVERRRRHDSSVKMRQEHWLCQSSGSRWNPIEKQKLLTARYATPTILHRLLHHHNIFMYIGSDGTWEGLAPAADTCPFWISTPPSCVLDVTVFSISARCSSMASSCVLAIMSRWSSVDVSEEADEIPATYHLHRRCAGSLSITASSCPIWARGYACMYMCKTHAHTLAAASLLLSFEIFYPEIGHQPQSHNDNAYHLPTSFSLVYFLLDDGTSWNRWRWEQLADENSRISMFWSL